MGCHSRLQGIFPIQGSNLGLLGCRQILCRLSHPGSPVLLLCVSHYYLLFTYLMGKICATVFSPSLRNEYVYMYSVAELCLTFCDPMGCSPQAPVFMDFYRQEYSSGFLYPTLGIFQTQGLNRHLLNWQMNSLPLRHLGSPS